MAQTAPTYGAPPPGALSRRLREPRVPTVPRLHGVDCAWMAAFAAISLCIGYYTGGASILRHSATYIALVTVVLQYFIGFRVRDRATGVIACGLLATSPLFCGAAQPPRDALFVMFTLAALAAYVAEANVTAMALAACATMMHPEGIVLAAVLLGLSVNDRRRGWIVGILTYFVLTIAGLAGLLFIGHGHITVPAFKPHIEPFASLFHLQTGIVAIFVCAMLDDLSDPGRRTRWKPIVGWAVLYLGVVSLIRFSDQPWDDGPFRPVLFVLAGAGIARLFPVVAGNFASPIARYAVAAIFFATLTQMRISAEWPTAHARSGAATTTAATGENAAQPILTASQGLQAVSLVQPKLSAKTSAGATPARSAEATTAPHQTPILPLLSKERVGVRSLWTPAVHPMPVVHTAALNTPASHPVADHASQQSSGTDASILAQAASLGIPTSIVAYGQHIPRNIWAIHWDITQKLAAQSSRHASTTHSTAGVKHG